MFGLPSQADELRASPDIASDGRYVNCVLSGKTPTINSSRSFLLSILSAPAAAAFITCDLLCRRQPMRIRNGLGADGPMGRRKHTALSTLHCGAGCTPADLIGEWFTVTVPVSIGGSLIAGSWVPEYGLALLIGLWFQYAAIRSMRAIGRRQAIVKAAKADLLSLTA